MLKTLVLGVALFGVIYLLGVAWMRWLLDRDDRESEARLMQERIDTARKERTHGTTTR
jgi:hypothetical protein